MEGDCSAEDHGVYKKIVPYKKKAFFFFSITPGLPSQHREYLTMMNLS